MSWPITHEPIVALGGLVGFAAFQLLFVRIIRTRAAMISNGIKSATRETYTAVGQVFGGIKPVITGIAREHFALRHDEPLKKRAGHGPQGTLMSSMAKYALETIV